MKRFVLFCTIVVSFTACNNNTKFSVEGEIANAEKEMLYLLCDIELIYIRMPESDHG